MRGLLALLARAGGELLLGLEDVGILLRLPFRLLLRGGALGILPIESLKLQLGDLLLDELLDGSELLFGLRRDERHGEARLACAPGAPDAVDIAFRRRGQVVVDDVGDLVDVDSARENIGRHDDVNLPVREALERALARVLRPVRVDRLGGVAGLLETAADRVRAASRAREDDDAPRALLLQKRAQELRAGELGGADEVLLDRVGHIAAMGDLDTGGIAHERLGVLVHRVIDGGGEQQRLACGGRRRHDALDRGPEPHVEHAVRLVEHERLHVAQAHGVLVHEVDETAGRGDEHVGAALEPVDLGRVGEPSHDGEDAVVARLGDAPAYLADLLRELARRRDDEDERPLSALGVSDAVEQGERERGGFAGSRLRRGDYVAAAQRERNRLLLNGRRLGVSQKPDGFQGALGQSERIE